MRIRPVSLLLLVPLLAFSCGGMRHDVRTEPGMGVASWYGAEFQGRPTASGERFDMHALTCAHRELPFGSIVKVTNLAGGRSVRREIDVLANMRTQRLGKSC